VSKYADLITEAREALIFSNYEDGLVNRLADALEEMEKAND
jgi:hypothetical protein